MTPARRTIPNVLSIAGSDPSGGAGIQADLKTFAAIGCHGMAVLTALTAQNTRGVSAVHLPPATFVAQQIAMIVADIDVHAIKIGMLGSAEIVEAVAAALDPNRAVPIVLDPVLVATSGATLGDDGVIEAMRRTLFPIATLITPNLAEVSRLAEVEPPETVFAMEAAAGRLRGNGAAAWLLKGGHSSTDTADDLLLDDQGPHWISSMRVETRNTHGTGCTLSSAIAAHLALGATLRESVERAKRYIDSALAGADRLAVGTGPGPIDHFAAWR